MIWTTWRQHRFEALWAALLAGLLMTLTWFVGSQLQAAACSGPGHSVCLADDLPGRVAQFIVGLNLYNYGLAVLPGLAGAFIGAPLVAREVENGTHRLAWTQGVTRLRWFTVKLVLVAIPLLLAAAAAGLLEVWLLNVASARANHWAFFDQQAPLTAAATLFALALGVAWGAVIGRSIPAMAATLVSFVVVRIALAETVRPLYQPALAYTARDMSNFNNPPTAYPDAWWLDQPSYYDSAGRVLSNGGFKPAGSVAYAIQHYQPAERFWAFQSIESALLAALALAILGFAVYWVTRRIS
ncbi:MAG TPA: hypothetical protein VF134_03700 [Candidatus Dormibacteraeota bacterium]